MSLGVSSSVSSSVSAGVSVGVSVSVTVECKFYDSPLSEIIFARDLH